MASQLAEGIKAKGYGFLTKPVSNQIFPILPNKMIEKLRLKYSFYSWKKVDEGHTAIRLVTSWATKQESVDKFLSDLK